MGRWGRGEGREGDSLVHANSEEKGKKKPQQTD